MKQIGKCLTGDPVRIDRFTAEWMTIRLHPALFYRRIESFQQTLYKIKGLYAEIDMGQYVMLRFSEKDDVTAFHKAHHDYI